MSDSGWIPRVSFDDYHELAASTAIYPESGTGGLLALLYVACGLAGEVGEVANQIKKVARDDAGQISWNRKVKLADEMGDVFWYVSRMCAELGLDPGEVMQANLAKLDKRSQEGTLHGDGADRRTPPSVYPYGDPLGVAVEPGLDGFVRVSVRSTGGIVEMLVQHAEKRVERVSHNGDELCGEDLAQVMPWLMPLVNGIYETEVLAEPVAWSTGVEDLPASTHNPETGTPLPPVLPQPGTVYDTSEGKLHRMDPKEVIQTPPVSPEQFELDHELAQGNPPEQIQFAATFMPGKGPHKGGSISRLWYDFSEEDARRNIMARFGPNTVIENIKPIS